MPGSTFEVWSLWETQWSYPLPILLAPPSSLALVPRDKPVRWNRGSTSRHAQAPWPPPPSSPETELLFLRRLQDLRVEEGQDVCLEVETGRVGAAGAVRWVRGGEPLPHDSRLSVAQDGHIYRLFIHGVVLADQGTYGCESHHDRTLARLSVRRECPVLS